MANTIINNPDFDTVNSPYRASTEDLLYQLQQIALAVSGGGGGDATSLNQSTQITLASALNSLIGVGNASTSTIASETTQTVAELVLIKAQEVIANTKLDQIITNTGTPITGGATSAKQDTQISALNLSNAYLDSIYNIRLSNIDLRLGLINGVNNRYINTSTGGITTINTRYIAIDTPEFNRLILQFETNVGAVGTLDVTAKTSSASNNIRLPLIDMQALFIGAYLNPPFNVAGAKLFSLDIKGLYSITLTPSVLNSTYGIQYSLSV